MLVETKFLDILKRVYELHVQPGKMVYVYNAIDFWVRSAL